MSDFDLDSYLAARRTAVNTVLDIALRLPADQPDPGQLREAMRYAVLQGGKRMRPLLAIATCEAVGGHLGQALPPGCAIEMIHAYSLVHDDLPAMDNDELRRGRPTVWKKYGQGNAILVGDALLTAAMQVLLADESSLPRSAAGQLDGLLAEHAIEGIASEAVYRAVVLFSRHAGIDGMVGGQALDLVEGQHVPTLERLETVHALKTGGLFAAAGGLGALAGRAAAEDVDRLERFGLAFGIAFQHADDILDGDQPELREPAARRIAELTDECRGIAARYGDAGRQLRALADWIDERAQRARQGEQLA